MMGFYHLLSLLPILGLTVAGQEGFQLVHLQEAKALSFNSYALNPNPPPSIGVSVSEVDLPVVSSSVLAAEGWLRTHVLAYFPSTNITTIIVGRGVLCSRAHEHLWGLVLPSVKNLYHSLVRWALEKEIKISAAFSSDCLQHSFLLPRFKADIAQGTIKPLLSFLHDTSSAYTIDQPPLSSLMAEKALSASAHRTALRRLGLYRLRDIRVMGEATLLPVKRKLSSLGFSASIPERPKPVGSQVPSRLARNSSPPSIRYASPPDASPPDALAAPPLPCLAAAAAPAPGSWEGQKAGLWCVAKPTVPAETLQEAMDYACGDGGAECEEIWPNGSCFYPDNVVAHASYAFNSYWQKTKRTGGSCSFDGTAVLINSDPSFLQCHFVLS